MVNRYGWFENAVVLAVRRFDRNHFNTHNQKLFLAKTETHAARDTTVKHVWFAPSAPHPRIGIKLPVVPTEFLHCGLLKSPPDYVKTSYPAFFGAEGNEPLAIQPVDTLSTGATEEPMSSTAPRLNFKQDYLRKPGSLNVVVIRLSRPAWCEVNKLAHSQSLTEPTQSKWKLCVCWWCDLLTDSSSTINLSTIRPKTIVQNLVANFFGLSQTRLHAWYLPMFKNVVLCLSMYCTVTFCSTKVLTRHDLTGKSEITKYTISLTSKILERSCCGPRYWHLVWWVLLKSQIKNAARNVKDRLWRAGLLPITVLYKKHMKLHEKPIILILLDVPDINYGIVSVFHNSCLVWLNLKCPSAVLWRFWCARTYVVSPLTRAL